MARDLSKVMLKMTDVEKVKLLEACDTWDGGAGSIGYLCFLIAGDFVKRAGLAEPDEGSDAWVIQSVRALGFDFDENYCCTSDAADYVKSAAKNLSLVI